MREASLDDIIASLLRERNGPETLPERFCEACMATMDITAMALTVTGPDDNHLVVAASDPMSRRLQELEFDLGEGPGVDANHAGGPVLVVDLRDAEWTSPWTTYERAAAETTIRSQFSFPLQIGVIRLGILTFYRDWAAALTEAEMGRALVLADVATVLLLHLQDVSDDGADLHDHVESPFTSVAELHQATGMVSVQAAVGMTEALLLLRSRAFSSGGTPLEVAYEVLGGRMNFRSEGGHDG